MQSSSYTPAANEVTAEQPACVLQLQSLYGAPSQAGFGSAVFYDLCSNSSQEEPLEHFGLAKYRYFCGEKWDQFGEAAWMSGWKLLYQRSMGAAIASQSPPSERASAVGIVAELKSIKERPVRNLVPMLVDEVEAPEAARSALSAGFDDPEVSECSIYSVGDGAAMSGLMIVGRRGASSMMGLILLLD